MNGTLVKKGKEWFVRHQEASGPNGWISDLRMPKEIIVSPDIATCLSRFFGVPVNKLEGLKVLFDIKDGQVVLINSFEALEEAVADALSPSKRFKTVNDLKEFLKAATRAELDGILEACLLEENYEYAAVVNGIINIK